MDVGESRDGFHVERGRIDEVVYVGMVTRYLIDLDAGGKLVVIRQNLERSTKDLEERGRAVALAWRQEHEYAVESQAREEKE
jgi:putative spermidine/putrescine transport system ATP-binding protein